LYPPELVRGQDTGAADAGANRPAAEWLRDRRLRRPTTVTAIFLAPALTAKDNAFWLADEVLVGAAVASLAIRKTAPD
jgi:hypothetical protein